MQCPLLKVRFPLPALVMLEIYHPSNRLLQVQYRHNFRCINYSAEAKALLPSAKMPPNKVPPAPRWPTPYPLTSEWQAPPQKYMRQYENCSTIQRGPYELKPSEYFMPSYSPYPEWIASSMMTGTNLVCCAIVVCPR